MQPSISAPTVSEIAARAGVSEQTVVRALVHSPHLGEAAREKVDRAIAKAGGYPEPPPRRLASSRTAQVTLVYDDILASCLPDIQAGMSAALEGSGYLLSVQRYDDSGQHALRTFGEFLEYQRPSGILLMPTLADTDMLAGQAWEFGCKCARLGADPLGSPAGWFTTPDRRAAAEAVNWLASQGHSRIGFVAGPDSSRAARLRELGYLDAMAEHGFDRGPSLIAQGDNTLESGMAAADLLLQVSPAPTAILTCNDDMAAGAIRAAKVRNLSVPDDISVVGFEDLQLASRLAPSLTTIRVPWLEMAYAATLQLIDDSSPECRGQAFSAELIERESVATLA